MKKKLFALLVLLMSSHSCWAEMESWYTMWSFGLADTHYPKALDQQFNMVDALPGAQRTQGAIDMFGFYWPLDQGQTVLGVIVSGAFDRVEAGSTYFQFNQYLYALSGMRFFGKEVGDGFFLRGDAGIANAMIDSSAGDSASENGSGFLLGGGFGLPVSPESRVLFQLSYSIKRIEGERYSTAAFSISGLW